MSENREIIHFPLNCTIHSPTYSGVRVTADAAEYARTLYEVPGPLIVVEEGAVFTGITWDPWNPRIDHTKPDILAERNSWKIAFPPGAGIRRYPPESTLDGAVTHYREERRMPPPPGKATLDRIRRAVYLDLCLVDGRVAHTFRDACGLLAELERAGLAEGTLLYLAGWQGAYDTRMPAWKPAQNLGGRAGFAELVGQSKEVGAIVLPHMNFWGYDKSSGLMPEWEKTWTGHRWMGNTGICPGNPIEYMQIDDPAWITLFDGYFDRAVEEFGLEAVFLDQCGNAYDSPKGDPVGATRALLERIHGKFPDLLLGAEVLSEHIVDHVPLIQACWLMAQNIGKFSPITRMMFEGRIRFIPHLFLAASHPCRYVYTNMPLIVEEGVESVFAWYQENTRLLGGIPSVRLDYARAGIDSTSKAVLHSA